MPRVLVTPPMWNQRPGKYREILEQAGFEVVYPPADANLTQPAVMRQVLQGVDALLASTEPLTRGILAARSLIGGASLGELSSLLWGELGSHPTLQLISLGLGHDHRRQHRLRQTDIDRGRGRHSNADLGQLQRRQWNRCVHNTECPGQDSGQSDFQQKRHKLH